MTRINTNISSLTAQKILAQSNAALQQSLTRLSTGLRINSGKDDPAGLIASENLHRDIVSVNKAISNSERANQMIATADSALGQVSSMLTDMRALIVEASNEGAMSEEQIAANQLQIDSSLAAINRIAQTTTFQGRRLLDGSLDFITENWVGAANVDDLQIDQANLGATGTVSVDIQIDVAATQARITSTVSSATAAAAATITTVDGGILTITAENDGEEYNDYSVSFVETASVTAAAPQVIVNDDDKTVTIYVNNLADTDLADIDAAFDEPWASQFSAAVTNPGLYQFDEANDAAISETTAGGASSGLAADLVVEISGTKGSQVFNFEVGTTLAQIEDAINLVSDATGVLASDDGADELWLDSSEYGSDAFVAVNVISGSQTFSATRDEGTDIEATVNGMIANGDGNTLSINTATLAMTVTVPDGSALAASFDITGGGALFQLGPDVVSNQQTRMGIQSLSTASLGGTAGRLYQLASGESASLTTDTTTAAEIIDQVLDKVTGLRGRLGAFQRTTLETNIATLGDTVEQLTAAESSIRDADFASETAAMTRAQILVQSGVSVLAIANSGPQNVLALLRG